MKSAELKELVTITVTNFRGTHSIWYSGVTTRKAKEAMVQDIVSKELPGGRAEYPSFSVVVEMAPQDD